MGQSSHTWVSPDASPSRPKYSWDFKCVHKLCNYGRVGKKQRAERQRGEMREQDEKAITLFKQESECHRIPRPDWLYLMWPQAAAITEPFRLITAWFWSPEPHQSVISIKAKLIGCKRGVRRPAEISYSVWVTLWSHSISGECMRGFPSWQLWQRPEEQESMQSCDTVCSAYDDFRDAARCQLIWTSAMQSGAKKKTTKYLLWNANNWPHLTLATHRREQTLKDWEQHHAADSLPSSELMMSHNVHRRKKENKRKQC